MEHIGSCNPWAVAWDLVTLRPIQKGGCPRFLQKVGVPDLSSQISNRAAPTKPLYRPHASALMTWLK